MSDVVDLLLADRSPSLRLRALLELLAVAPDDPEALDLASRIDTSEEVEAALAECAPDVRGWSYTLSRLAFLGLGRGHPKVDELAEHVFDGQRPDGSWLLAATPTAGARKRRTPVARPASEGNTMLPMQTSIPLRGLASAGYPTDPRTERGYEWLLSKQLEDGAWMGTKADDVRTRTPGYRKLPRSEGCRSNTTGAVAALSLHPTRRTADATRAGLDHLLQRETRDEYALGYEVSRLLTVERTLGGVTFYRVFDLGFLLDIATRCGVSNEDRRAAELVEFLQSSRGQFGLWDHWQHPQLSRWLTLDLLCSLQRLESGDWAGTDIRVPYASYPKQRRRY